MKIDFDRINSKPTPLMNYLDSLVRVPDNLSTLYHYTSIEALLNGIIVNNPSEGKEICLWASNCEYMNDPDEVKTGRRFAEKIFGISQPDFKKSLLKSEEKIREKLFITSFSSTKDCLPMWRMYGNNCYGISLGFDAKIILDMCKGVIYQCLYIDNKYRRELNTLFNNVSNADCNTQNDFKQVLERMALALLDNISNFVYLFVFAMFLAKNPYYSYEKECRLFLIAEQNIEFRHRNNLIIPYIKYYLPKSALKEIWIGPANDMARVTKSLKKYLDYMGFGHVVIKKSQIPYRG